MLTLRVALSIFALYVASERAVPQPCHFEEARNGWSVMPLQYTEGLAFKLVGVWERWDACWYAHIATTGYQGDGSTAFFPLFPALERVVALFGPHVVIAGMIIDLVAAVLALWGIHRIVEDDHGRDVARRAILLLGVFPASLFLIAPFSEAILLAASVWSLDSARRGRWSAAALCAFLAALARPVGIVLVLPLLWTAWQRRAARGERVAAAVAVAAAPAAFGAFLLYTARVVGVSMFAASALWTGSAYHPPWDVLAAALDWTRRRGDPLEALELALLVGVTVLLVVGAARLRADLSLYAAPQVAFLWLRILPTPLTSTSRYLLVVFPAFVVLALLLERRRALWSYAVVSLLVLGAVANEFVIGDFVG